MLFVFLHLDLNECQHENICGPNTSCVNTPGSHHCECKKGFALSSDQTTSEGAAEICKGEGIIMNASQGEINPECQYFLMVFI